MRRTSPAKNAAIRPSRSSTQRRRRRLRDDLAELQQQPARLVVQRRVGDRLRALEGLRRPRSSLTLTPTKRTPCVGRPGGDLVERRRLGAARGAPRRPEVQHHDLAAQVGDASGSPSSVVPDSAGAGCRSSTAMRPSSPVSSVSSCGDAGSVRRRAVRAAARRQREHAARAQRRPRRDVGTPDHRPRRATRPPAGGASVHAPRPGASYGDRRSGAVPLRARSRATRRRTGRLAVGHRHDPVVVPGDAGERGEAALPAVGAVPERAALDVAAGRPDRQLVADAAPPRGPRARSRALSAAASIRRAMTTYGSPQLGTNGLRRWGQYCGLLEDAVADADLLALEDVLALDQPLVGADLAARTASAIGRGGLLRALQRRGDDRGDVAPVAGPRRRRRAICSPSSESRKPGSRPYSTASGLWTSPWRSRCTVVRVMSRSFSSVGAWWRRSSGASTAAAARAACGRASATRSSACVVVRGADEPRLVRARRQVDAAREHLVEERLVAPATFCCEAVA